MFTLTSPLQPPFWYVPPSLPPCLSCRNCVAPPADAQTVPDPRRAMNPLVKARLHAEWLTTDELAAYTGLSTATIKQKAHRGTIDSVKKGGILLFWKGDFLPAASAP